MIGLTRRQFVKGSVISFGGLMVADLFHPGSLGADETGFKESDCKKNEGKKILVAYKSHCGSTSGVAKTIADTLCNKGIDVDLRNIKSVSDISGYHGAVIGSAVKSGSWYQEAISFVEAHQASLSKIPVAYFLTCLALYDDNQKSRDLAQSYFNPVLKTVPTVRPEAMGGFAGALDYSKLNMVTRLVMKSKMEAKGVPEGDFRDFNKIEDWAKKNSFPYF